MEQHAAGSEPDRLSLPEPASPEQLEQSERLLRQAHVCKMRGDLNGAQNLIEQAVEVAPGSSAVHEALGDILADRRRLGQARDAYRLATRLDPKNVSAERKYAEAILGLNPVEASALGISASETYASGKAAVVLNIFAPGVGQMVTGRVSRGLLMLSAYAVSVLLTILVPNGLRGLVSLLGGEGPPFNGFVLVPMAFAAFFYLWALYDAAGNADRVAPRARQRPAPPSDLPFE
jgi:tetratricopeptide (TPR) repeat protein